MKTEKAVSSFAQKGKFLRSRNPGKHFGTSRFRAVMILLGYIVDLRSHRKWSLADVAESVNGGAQIQAEG